MQGAFVYVILFAVILLLVYSLGTPKEDDVIEMSYSTFLKWVEADLKNNENLGASLEESQWTISNVLITEKTLVARTENSSIPLSEFGSRYDIVTTIPSEEQFYLDVNQIYKNLLGREVSPAEYDFDIETKLPAGTPWYVTWLPTIVMIGLVILLYYFIMRQQTGSGKGMASFGKSRARLTDPKSNSVTFKDVAGADEEKEELREIVEFLKNPEQFIKVGARIPKGVLLVGPPGTGKTLLARAVSGEAGVPFYTISGSDFVEMFVGVGASRVRDLFNQAKKTAPSIIFIDEIDAVGRQRGAGMGGGHDEREQTLNQLLVEMDGFSYNQGVIVMAATNRSDILDPALLRPGRFDRRIVVNYPDVKGREEILKVHSRGKPLAKDVDLKVLARRTPYFTGADLENVMNEAAILAARKKKAEITMAMIEEAVTRVLSGPEKRSHQVTDKDRKLVAYHEGGHAIVSYYIPECDTVHEITTIPRGQAGGYTMFLPKEETGYQTRSYLSARIASLMGGRVAEALVIGEISTGASADIKQATEIARSMVTEYGMSDKAGPIFLGGDQEVFLGRSFSQQHSAFSEEINSLIDREVHALISDGYNRAETILTEHMDQLHGLAQILLDREKLDFEEFKQFMQTGSLSEKAPESDSSAASAQEGASSGDSAEQTPGQESAEQSSSSEDRLTQI
ncbi:MAG TPA: ATP-dependent zinc metalloprotease FtsH [Candidatus Pullichristensenella excrementigallinarum]|uniref:ATP-dependent zinc metalloprotease FtsH n=1 Tax=Candidatus Pullichristensenella excrementigallinarum TaxID=2840907 RepID=A0A9D1ICU5_9FIRM|nr:ATP-dependent zinc metalloprotease FtsH [Candidatus Pullichristensenella excrementigallinarum]